MKPKYKNEKKSKAISKVNSKLNTEIENIKKLEESKNHMCFNFEYVTYGEDSGDKISAWSHKQLIELLEKMVEYCKKTKTELISEKYFAEYGEYRTFKHKFSFPYPKNVPYTKVKWARFRLNNKVRLIGFFTGNTNIFYAVFLDKDHKFYPVEKR